MYIKNKDSVAGPLVSILIVTLRGGENLRKCLISIKKNIYKSFELVIVNNGGGTKIASEVKKIFPEARMVNSKKNTGFAEGNNIGLKYCKGKYVLFLNDDTVATPDFLKILVEFGEKNSLAAVIQPKTIFTKGKLQSGADYLTPTGFLYHYGYGKDPDNPIYNSPLDIYAANGNCMFVRSEVIKKVGLFDKDFFAYFEETGFCHRVWMAGFKVVYFPKATVYHRGAETSKMMDQKILLFHQLKNRLCAHLKNLGLTNLIKILPMLLVLYQLLFLFYLFNRKIKEALYTQKAIWWNIINLPTTLKKRNWVQKNVRKIKDDDFFDIISYSPRLSYYLHLFFGLEKYKDEDRLIHEKIMQDKEKLISSKTSVLAATFSLWINGVRLPTNGSVEPMISFFTPRSGKFVLIDQPYPGSDFLNPRVEVYQNNKMTQISSTSKWLYFLLNPFLELTNKPGTHIPFKIRDFLSVIDWRLRDKTLFEIFIGFECVNALAGILLRNLGLIKKVIYYVSDYSPNRYPQKWFNSLYLFLDKFVAYHADYIWDVSKAMQPARINAGLDPVKSAPVLYMPNALYPSQIKYSKVDDIIPFSLVFMGGLGPENGPELIIEALPIILKRYPKTVFHVVGGGKTDIERLKVTARDFRVENAVKFYGYIISGEEMSKKIRKFHIALAPYRSIPGSPRYYGDAGKIRAYAAAGLPIITTDVPPLGKEVKNIGAALIVKDNPSDIASAVVKIFSDHKLYIQLRKGAISFAKHNTWENEFINVFQQMEKYDRL